MVNKLREASPYKTGQLHDSIQLLQNPDSPENWIILIGNDTATKRDVPSNFYASFTNFDPKKKTYHWVNDAIEEWAKENSLLFNESGDEEEDE